MQLILHKFLVAKNYIIFVKSYTKTNKLWFLLLWAVNLTLV